MNSNKQKGHLYRSMQAITIIPLLILGLVITIFSYQTVESAMHTEVEAELKNITSAVILTYDMLYPGDYKLVGTSSYDLLKGDSVITSDYTIIDRLQAETQIDITIFYQDTRILTTLRDSENMRIIGTGVNKLVVNDVLLTGQPRFYTNTLIYEVQYFAYYAPLRNSDGSIVGMIYAGKPCAQVNAAVRQAVLPIILISLCGMVIVSLITSVYTHRLIASLQKIRSFLSKVSTGNLWEELDADVLQRNDELSEMGYSALYMQRSLRNLVEQDTLTELNNRRFADKRLKQTQMQANIHGTHFVIMIGDIDLFKSINDTYGHECGDLVLKRVSFVLKKNMVGKGFVARWGGEEFLFLYENTDIESIYAEAEKLLNDIRNMSVTYDDQSIKITMTFGLAEGGVNSNIKELLQEADSKLYRGKSQGRNQIVI